MTSARDTQAAALAGVIRSMAPSTVTRGLSAAMAAAAARTFGSPRSLIR
jgi:hypothetical protein